ncbi:hypothetical protein [Roseitranquillus sediminis]|uniref:hypothetical protein n=1 Tax=Roseitranquillus sediminis TaxID=2809051 RepID=UPI001D0C11BA|nr:hypothetical protein [Roseitranquillus sediminis]MBM9593302.1 hypothetical protein [Roseitranquillus sediminis]
MDAIFQEDARSVTAADGCDEEIYRALKGLSERCQENMIALAEELAQADPEAEERCGMLDGRHEVFALRASGCGRARLLVSVDTRAAGRPVTIHGIAGTDPCAAARALVSRHFNLRSAIWET